MSSNDPRVKNIFVLGLDDFNRRMLATIRDAEAYEFHGLLPPAAVDAAARYSIPELIDEALAELRAFPGSVDAIIGYFDFPVSTILPILRSELGLPTPSLEAVLKCEHKYWSRLEQQRCISQHIPEFAAVDPFAPGLEESPPLDFPFWVKPVKSLGSHLGFRIADSSGWRNAVRALRTQVSRLGGPFEDVLTRVAAPVEIACLGGTACLAEKLIHGRQCTLEGFVQGGEAEVYGVVDSFRHANSNRTTFGRYQYPSQLPRAVRERMIEIARCALRQIGYDNAPFNIEMFYAPERDQIWLLEINTRGSQSHCPLFQMVDGRSHHEIMVEVALGRRPEFPHRQGQFRHSAKFMLRHYDDARVLRVPDAAEIRRMEELVPGALCQIHVKSGDVLSNLEEQDSYSFELGAIFVGGQSRAELMRNYQKCLSLLPFELQAISPHLAA